MVAHHLGRRLQPDLPGAGRRHVDHLHRCGPDGRGLGRLGLRVLPRKLRTLTSLLP
ncbi:hypothetical protein FRIGORI9N_330015 [Frigoribacterium sp. 9N]|nr:hypothetical protein FRIGORI9N_330015 [Frigoribacterium sp. 9N]